jgi:hypothetical protein
MRPKEKAENLVNNYRYILMAEDTDCGEEILCTKIAKRCALFTVDEIRDNLPLITDIQNHWLQVKQEIEQL